MINLKLRLAQARFDVAKQELELQLEEDQKGRVGIPAEAPSERRAAPAAYAILQQVEKVIETAYGTPPGRDIEVDIPALGPLPPGDDSHWNLLPDRLLRLLNDKAASRRLAAMSPAPRETVDVIDEEAPAASGDQVASACVTKIKRAIEELGGAGTVPAIARRADLTQAITASTLEQFQRNLFKCDPGGIWKLRNL